MKKAIGIIVTCISILSNTNAQNDYLAANSKAHTVTESATAVNTATYFTFTAISQDVYVNQIAPEDAGKHFLGDDIARKMFLFRKTYTYRVAIAPGSFATKLIFRKPEIYNSVKKIDSFLKDEVKKRILTANDAKTQFNKVLDIALNIISEDTSGFENHLSTANGNAGRLLKIYLDEVVLKELN